MLRLGFQCVGILNADLGTSPLYVFSNTFKYNVGLEDDMSAVLFLIIYSFLLFAMVKIIFIALYANDDGDGACQRSSLTIQIHVSSETIIYQSEV